MTASNGEDITGSTRPAERGKEAADVEALPSLFWPAAMDDPQSGVVIFDTLLRVLHLTSQAPRVLELQPERREAVESLTVLDLLSHSALDDASVENARRRIIDFNKNELNKIDFNGDAEPITVLLQSRDHNRSIRMRLRSVGQEYRLASFENVVSEEAPKSKISEFALRDSLTGLAARHYFEDILRKVLEQESAEPVTLFLIDLDRFKAVNDTLGHAAGDTVLKLAAERLKTAVRKDDIVARLGGDEFAVLMQVGTTLDQTIAIAVRILDLVQRTYLIEGQLVNIGTSVGIARSPHDGNNAASLMRSADLALYHSKSSGRATYHFFEDQMESRAQARRTSELELRRALALRQLELFYQPQVDTMNDRLTGFEALLRWRHPEKGMISPADFLPIAEEIGVIVPIGEWVLRTACREAMNWPSHITVAVNASPLQFDAGNFAESVRRALNNTGLPGERLEIEITEGIMLRNDEKILNTLHALRGMKVKIAMDDFGTGYASLGQLARFPFDKIKIDRSLVGFEGEDLKQRAIVRAITTLGQSLGVSTLAEGIENADQLARLQRDGCTSVQGYLYSKPVPTNQLKEILARFS